VNADTRPPLHDACPGAILMCIPSTRQRAFTMSRMTRKSFLMFLGLGGVVPSACGEEGSGGWVDWLCQGLGMKRSLTPSVVNCGAYYTPSSLASTILGYDPVCGSGGFLASAQGSLEERVSLG
jgi:hypothetical protein